ncbi:MAG: aminotransferase class III-fold pyridoxal phosphate-dependent enzyme [Candidatus Scalindua sp.]|nr:aminotransferase class III-fold pyridoxal phosphate-dependent enzyme [Candidatus Scalindua sp.]
MKKGIKLWQRAIKTIPGGNGLLSKRPDRYAPDIWPTYFSKAKGVEIWDIDGDRYIDMAQMGLGTAILGYSNSEVNQAVKEAVDDCVNSTLNAPEEVLLAEKLLELNPFAGGVKFARTGSEAMAIAVRIARAYSGKDKIAFSGYHGWSDWYLAANLESDSNLSDHLLPGLKPKGVPLALCGTTIPFAYNNVDALEALAEDEDIGVIVIEGARYDFPTPEFISAVQRVAVDKNAVVVVDEITSGWRMTDGGVYKLNGLNPDIVVYGKGMGNGFAISAVIGRKEVMDQAQETFISGTFWTERIGFSAALRTIEILVREKVWEHLIAIGTKIGNGWELLAQKHGLKLTITDFKPLITMKFDYGELSSAIVTLFTQEMLKRGYIAASSIYVSYAHNEAIVEEYLERVDEVFGIMADAITNNSISEKLETSIRDEGFKRLT